MTPFLAPTFTSHLNLRLLETPPETNSGYATGNIAVIMMMPVSDSASRPKHTDTTFARNINPVPEAKRGNQLSMLSENTVIPLTVGCQHQTDGTHYNNDWCYCLPPDVLDRSI